MKKQLALVALAVLASVGVQAQEKVLNLYSARHYQTDEKLYDNFTKQTGIKINRIEGKEDELMVRLRNGGPNSPAHARPRLTRSASVARCSCRHVPGNAGRTGRADGSAPGQIGVMRKA